MKKTAFTTALLALSVSSGFAEHHGHHGHHVAAHTIHVEHHGHHGHHDSLAHQTQSRESLLKRLAIAPTHYGCSTNVHAVERAALSAHTVKMLGKVEYDYGKSWLSGRSRHAIEDVILHARIKHGPNALIAVLGYADKTGRAHINYRLSDTRATNVQKHIDHVNWEHNLGLRTTSIAMGEEVELCEYDLGHNRVAEIWLIEFPKPVSHFFSLEPVVEQHVVTAPVQQQVVTPLPQAPVQNVVTTAVQQAPQTVIQTQPVTAATPNPLAQLAEFLEHNVMLAPNADPAEFARQLSILKTLSN